MLSEILLRKVEVVNGDQHGELLLLLHRTENGGGLKLVFQVERAGWLVQ